MQGPCYYPAGHLWMWGAIYKVMTSTEHAFDLLKGMFIGLHTVSVVTVCLIALNMLRRNTQRAQLVCFMVFTNFNEKLIIREMFNDSIMFTFIAISIYLVTSKRPLSAALALGFASSLKAGGILVYPAFLGSV